MEDYQKYLQPAATAFKGKFRSSWLFVNMLSISVVDNHLSTEKPVLKAQLRF